MSVSPICRRGQLGLGTSTLGNESLCHENLLPRVVFDSDTFSESIGIPSVVPTANSSSTTSISSYVDVTVDATIYSTADSAAHASADAIADTTPADSCTKDRHNDAERNIICSHSLLSESFPHENCIRSNSLFVHQYEIQRQSKADSAVLNVDGGSKVSTTRNNEFHGNKQPQSSSSARLKRVGLESRPADDDRGGRKLMKTMERSCRTDPVCEDGDEVKRVTSASFLSMQRADTVPSCAGLQDGIGENKRLVACTTHILESDTAKHTRRCTTSTECEDEKKGEKVIDCGLQRGCILRDVSEVASVNSVNSFTNSDVSHHQSSRRLRYRVSSMTSTAWVLALVIEQEV